MAIYHNISTKGSVSPSASTGASVSPSVSVFPSVSPSMPNKVYYDIMLPDEHFKPGYRFSIEECTCLIESFPVKKADGYLYRIVCKGYISKPLAGMRVGIDTPVGSISYPYQTVLLQVLPVSSQTAPSSQIPPGQFVYVDGDFVEFSEYSDLQNRIRNFCEKHGKLIVKGYESSYYDDITKQRFNVKNSGGKIMITKQLKDKPKEPVLGVDIPFLNEEDLVQPITR